MIPQSLDALISRLNAGEPAAIEELFVVCQSFLRSAVRRRLPAGWRGKFDSEDVVLSVWADLLSGFRERKWRFEDASRLRAFLLKAVRNRLVDRLRQHRAAAERERPMANHTSQMVPSTHPTRPSEVARADELWHRLVDLCPPAHREMLSLKRQGLSLAEIAERTGLHSSSVRRILYDLARRAGRDEAADRRS